jgi:hypothetical protein
MMAENHDVRVWVEFGVGARGHVPHGHLQGSGKACGLELPGLANVEQDGPVRASYVGRDAGVGVSRNGKAGRVNVDAGEVLWSDLGVDRLSERFREGHDASARTMESGWESRRIGRLDRAAGGNEGRNVRHRISLPFASLFRACRCQTARRPPVLTPLPSAGRPNSLNSTRGGQRANPLSEMRTFAASIVCTVFHGSGTRRAQAGFPQPGQNGWFKGG